jgi:hypothetical protein
MGFLEKWWKVGGLAGIASVVLLVIPAVLVADEPRYSDSGREIVSWYARHGGRWTLSIFIIGIALTFFLLPFLSALASVLERAEGEPHVWSRVAFASGLLIVAGMVTGWGGEGILSYLARDAGEEVARAGVAFALFIYAIIGLFVGAFVLSSSLVILKDHVFSPWLGWFGLVVTAVNILGAAAVFDTPDGFFGVLRTRVAPLALAVWIVAVSVGLIRIVDPERTAVPSGTRVNAPLDARRVGVSAGGPAGRT